MAGQIVRNMPMEQYQRIAALSASGAHLLTSECPAIYRHNSPFNPDFAPETKKEFDLGVAAHLAILEPHRMSERIVVVDADSWRRKSAQEQRESAYAGGLVPLLPQDLEIVENMAAAAGANPWVADLLDGCETEVSYFWSSAGVDCKARADLVTRDRAVLADVKTMHSANPLAIQRAAYEHGWFLRSAWYMDGWEIVTGGRALDYWYVVIDRAPPHVITPCRLDTRAVEWGRAMNRRALGLFRRCMREQDWPGYCREPITLGLPTHAEFRLADMEADGMLASDDVRRSLEFLSP
jgi:hypothetical protein